jgi:hypothetical protein
MPFRLAALSIAILVCALVAIRSQTLAAHHRIIRSAAARRAFRKQNPCPATGRVIGRCPGYVIDHIQPLACGGADAPFNMQWQTTADAKAKDAVERKDCAK